MIVTYFYFVRSNIIKGIINKKHIMEPINKIEQVKKKLQYIIENFKDFSIEKKLVLASLVGTGIILGVGTLFIILTTVFNVELSNNDEEMRKLSAEIETYSEEIGNNLDENGLEMMDEEIERIEKNFENYDEELKVIDEILNEFELPVSAPIE